MLQTWHPADTAKEAGASADGEHCVEVEGRADGRVLQTWHPADTAKGAGASADGEHCVKVEGRADATA